MLAAMATLQIARDPRKSALATAIACGNVAGVRVLRSEDNGGVISNLRNRQRARSTAMAPDGRSQGLPWT
jgi:hypothetical protein